MGVTPPPWTGPAVGGGDPKAIAQSWLICGPPGSGRSNVARAFAAALPPNIAPLNFKLKDACAEARAILECGPEKLEIKTGKDACFVIPASGWKRLLRTASGNHLNVTVQAFVNDEWIAYAPFIIKVAKARRTRRRRSSASADTPGW